MKTPPSRPPQDAPWFSRGFGHGSRNYEGPSPKAKAGSMAREYASLRDLKRDIVRALHGKPHT